MNILQVTSYPSIKNLSAKPTKFFPECSERSITREPDLNFTRVFKNSSFQTSLNSL